MRHLDDPSSGVEPEGLLGVDPGVRGYEGVPGAVALPVEEQNHVHSGIAGLDGGIVVSDGARILDCLGFDEPPDDVRSGKIADGGVVFGLAHLNHANEIALEVAAVDEPEQFGAGEPAVNKKIVEADAFRDGPAYHPDCVRNLALRRLGLPYVHFLIHGAILCVLRRLLLPCKALRSVHVLAGLACIVPSSISWVLPSV